MGCTLSRYTTRGLCFPILLLLAAFLSGFMASADAASTSASIFVNILPIKGMSNNTVRVTPKNISLTKNETAKLTIVNQSGKRSTIHMDVTPSSVDGCRLSYTPKNVVLEDGQAQVFRMFYVTQDSGDCRAFFQLNIQFDDGKTKTVEVHCN